MTHFLLLTLLLGSHAFANPQNEDVPTQDNIFDLSMNQEDHDSHDSHDSLSLDKNNSNDSTASTQEPSFEEKVDPLEQSFDGAEASSLPMEQPSISTNPYSRDLGNSHSSIPIALQETNQVDPYPYITKEDLAPYLKDLDTQKGQQRLFDYFKDHVNKNPTFMEKINNDALKIIEEMHKKNFFSEDLVHLINDELIGDVSFLDKLPYLTGKNKEHIQDVNDNNQDTNKEHIENKEDTHVVDLKNPVIHKEYLKNYMEKRDALEKGKDRKELDKHFLEDLKRYGIIDHQGKLFLEAASWRLPANVVQALNDHLAFYSSPFIIRDPKAPSYPSLSLDKAQQYIAERKNASTPADLYVIDTEFLKFLENERIIEVPKRVRKLFDDTDNESPFPSRIVDALYYLDPFTPILSSKAENENANQPKEEVLTLPMVQKYINERTMPRQDIDKVDDRFIKTISSLWQTTPEALVALRYADTQSIDPFPRKVVAAVENIDPFGEPFLNIDKRIDLQEAQDFLDKRSSLREKGDLSGIEELDHKFSEYLLRHRYTTYEAQHALNGFAYRGYPVNMARAVQSRR